MRGRPISLISKYNQQHSKTLPSKPDPHGGFKGGRRRKGGKEGREGGSICREYSECWNKASFTLTVENHDGCDVSASVAVIWSAPDGDEVLIEMVLVPLHHKLMGTCNQRQIINVIELYIVSTTSKKLWERWGVPPMQLYLRITILPHGETLPMFEYLTSTRI